MALQVYCLSSASAGGLNFVYFLNLQICHSKVCIIIACLASKIKLYSHRSKSSLISNCRKSLVELYRDTSLELLEKYFPKSTTKLVFTYFPLSTKNVNNLFSHKFTNLFVHLSFTCSFITIRGTFLQIRLQRVTLHYSRIEV